MAYKVILLGGFVGLAFFILRFFICLQVFDLLCFSK